MLAATLMSLSTLLPGADGGRRSCAVVGAGPAGLACARRLASSGVEVVLLEASERAGGRVWTAADACELGATWIHGIVGNRAFELACELGLMEERPNPRATPRRGDHACVWLRDDGKSVDAAAVRAARRVISAAIDECETGAATAAPAHAQTLGEHVHAAWSRALPELAAQHQDVPLLEAARRWAEGLQCASDGCGALREEGLVGFANYEELPGAHVRMPGGFSRLTDALAAPLAAAGALHLGTRVAAIDIDDDAGGERAVTVRCDGGESFAVDAVVMTASLEALQRVDFSPPLPPRTQAALGALRLGAVEKVHVDLEPMTCASDLTAGGAEGTQAEAAAADLEPVTSAADLTAGGAPAGGALPGAGGSGTRPPPPSVCLLWTAPPPCSERAAAPPRAEWPRSLYRLTAGEVGLAESSLVGWLTGDAARAVSGRPEPELLAELTSALEPFWAQLGWRPVGCRATSWAANPNFGGAYSFPLAHAPRDAADELARPLVAGGSGAAGVPRLLLAGEATSRAHFGTVHGAIESGEREAERLLGMWRTTTQAAHAGGVDGAAEPLPPQPLPGKAQRAVHSKPPAAPTAVLGAAVSTAAAVPGGRVAGRRVRDIRTADDD